MFTCREERFFGQYLVNMVAQTYSIFHNGCVANYSTGPEYYQCCLIQHHAGTNMYRIMAELNLKCIRTIVLDLCFTMRKTMTTDNQSKLHIHLQILCFHSISKVQVYEDHQSQINSSHNTNPLREPPSLIIMFSISSLKIVLLFFSINALSYMSQRLGR